MTQTSLTVADVKERIEEIRRAARDDDDEAAHAREDELHQDVLRHFAGLGHELAAEALKTCDIEFERWCA